MKILSSILEQVGIQTEHRPAVLDSEKNPEIAQLTEELVRQKAYDLWEQNGRPESDGIEFWLQAERELTQI